MASTTTTDYSTAGAFSYAVPAGGGVALLLGIGGGGGARGGQALTSGGGGGGGGAQASKMVTVAGGDTISGTVGAGGAGSNWNASTATDGTATTISLNSTLQVSAAPGLKSTSGTGGLGGTAAASTGTTKVSGSNGVNQASNSGGAGGAAGNSADLPGGAGGTKGVNGTAPGGGGGGGNAVNDAEGKGGLGGVGKARIVFMTFDDLATGTFQETYSTAGIFQWRAPETGSVLVQNVAGGGAGKGGVPLSSGAGGGQGGAYSDAIVSVVKNRLYDLVVGAGGVKGLYNAGNGGDGGDSSFSYNGTTLALAKGGKGSSGPTGATSDQLTTAIGDTKNTGYAGQSRPASSAYNAGGGGPAGLPIGGVGSSYNDQGAGTDGTAPGGGGSGGGANSGGNGGNGAPGCVRISYVKDYGKVNIGSSVKQITGGSVVIGGVRKAATVSRIVAGARTPVSAMKRDLDRRLRAYPAWLPSGQEALFDRRTGLFNAAAGLPNARAGLLANNFRAGFLGDSLVEGFTYLNDQLPYNSTVDRPGSYPYLARNRIVANRAGTTSGGTGVVRAVGALGTSDPRWNLDGASTSGHYAQFTTSQKPKFTTDKVGTAVAFSIFDVAGTFQIKVNGATSGAGFGSFTGSGSAAPRRIQLTGLNLVSGDVIELSTLTGDGFVIAAEVFTPGSGIVISNLGQGGSTIKGTGQGSWSDTSAAYGNMLPVYSQQAGVFGRVNDLNAISLGSNDMNGSGTRDYDGLATSFRYIGQTMDSSTTDILIVTEPHGSTTFATPPGWANPFYARQYTMALAEGWAILDLEWLCGGYEYINGLGYTGDIYGHFSSPAGATYIGNLVGDSLSTI